MPFLMKSIKCSTRITWFIRQRFWKQLKKVKIWHFKINKSRYLVKHTFYNAFTEILILNAGWKVVKLYFSGFIIIYICLTLYSLNQIYTNVGIDMFRLICLLTQYYRLQWYSRIGYFCTVILYYMKQWGDNDKFIMD